MFELTADKLIAKIHAKILIIYISKANKKDTADADKVYMKMY